MEFVVGPLIVDEGGTEPVLAVLVRTPRRRETRRSIEKLFRENTSYLTMLENQGQKVFFISVTLQDLGQLGPASFFIEALCNFLREHSFVVAENRTQVSPFRLTVGVSVGEDEDGGDDISVVDRSDPIIAEATSRICCAFWENERFRTVPFVYIDLPANPSREPGGNGSPSARQSRCGQR